ncbi:hypothetical protein N9C16_01535 [Paracoccaceae bacterium]|nr:hypothetical protein [Paracoccaceae bacterium]
MAKTIKQAPVTEEQTSGLKIIAHQYVTPDEPEFGNSVISASTVASGFGKSICPFQGVARFVHRDLPVRNDSPFTTSPSHSFNGIENIGVDPKCLGNGHDEADILECVSSQL